MYQALLYQENERVVSLTLNRPQQQNRLNELLIVELKDALKRAENSDHIRVIILKGNGTDFCEGWDEQHLQQLLTYNMNQHIADSATFGELLLSLYRSTKLVIGMAHGIAAGPGAALLTLCDWIYAEDQATFGFPEVKQGHAAAMILPFLLRKLPENQVRELILGGEMHSAAQVQKMGWVNSVLPKEQLEEEVNKLAQQVSLENAAPSLQLSKKMIADLQQMPLENAMRFATKMNAYARTTDYFRLGIQAWSQGEKPNW